MAGGHLVQMISLGQWRHVMLGNVGTVGGPYSQMVISKTVVGL